jgi:hypothetical protein
MKKRIVLLAVISVVIIGFSFFGGMKYGESKSPLGSFTGANFRGEAGLPSSSGSPVRSGNGTLNGEIVSLADGSLIIKIQDGSSKIVLFSGATEVSEMITGSIRDIKAGRIAMVSGTQNSDGSYTAKTIQLR